MDWLEIIIKIPAENTDKVAAIANMAVPYGIYVEDYSDLIEGSYEVAHVDLIDAALLNKDRTHSFIHIYIDKTVNTAEALAYINERLTAEKLEFAISFANVKEIDWNEYWKQFFHTTLIGQKLAVVPIWEKCNDNSRVQLKINPGAAFGTGTHATTSLCLELLEQTIDSRSTVLDIGCGSGILAIAGVLLGAKKAVGVDIDEIAVKVAKENAEMNSAFSKTEFLVGDLAEKVTGKYSVICANIVADVIIRLLKDIDKYLTDDGCVILSGIIDTRVNDIYDAIDKNNFSILKEYTKENWYAFLINKKGE